MVARSHVVTLASVFLSVLLSATVQGQQVVADVDSLSAAELAAELRRLQSILPSAPQALAVKLSKRAPALLGAANLSPEDRVLLARTLARHLSDKVRSAALSAIPVNAQGAGSFSALQGAVDSMAELGGDRAKSAALVSSWLGQQDESQFTVSELGWLVGQLTVPAVNPNAFTVQWRGFVTAPSDGGYTFSLSGVNSGSWQTRSRYAKQSVEVRVGERSVLSSASEKWHPVGETVTLAAGEPVPIAVDFAYANRARDRRLHPPVLALYWTGPGVPHQLIPSSALSTVGRAGPGLRAIYASEETGGTSQVDAQLAFVWTRANSIGSPSSDEIAALVDQLWQRATAPDVLAKASQGNAATTHPLLAYPYAMAELLASERQVEWLDTLKQQPHLIKGLPLRQVIDVYAAYRFYAPDSALDVLGSWMQHNAQMESKFAFRFGRENYTPFRTLAGMMTRQSPSHARLLQDEYLLTEKGGCCLPAAYTLAFVHIAREDWSAWERFLDAKLNGARLSPEARVDWLLARSMAEEVKFNSSNPDVRLSAFILRGKRFLRQALQLADSGTQKQRVYHELITRYLFLNNINEVERLIEEATDASSARLASWRSEIDRLREAVVLHQELRVIEREASRRKIYQKYLDKAKKNADEAAIQQYGELLDALD